MPYVVFSVFRRLVATRPSVPAMLQMISKLKRLHRRLRHEQLELDAAKRLATRIRLPSRRIHLGPVEQHHDAVRHALCNPPPAERNHTITPAGSATLGFRGVLIGAYSPPSN